MRWIWLAVILVTAPPVVVLAAIMNPLVILVLGVDWWRDWMTRLYPYKWQLASIALVFALSLTVYINQYT